MRGLSAILLVLTTTSCGLDVTSGGREHLPTAGLGPFGKLPLDAATPAEEPFVLFERQVVLDDPSALADDAGFRLWYSRRAAAMPLGGEIWTMRLGALTEPPIEAPALALAATMPWEAGSVRAPSVIRAGDPGADQLVMYYLAGLDDEPVIGRAHSDDDGATWVKDGPVTGLAAGAIDPAVLALPTGLHLYTGRLDGSGIDVAVAADPSGLAFTPLAAAIVAPPPAATAFDHVRVDAPAVAGGVSTAGQVHVNLYYQGTSVAGDTAIGSAASGDGATFVRFFRGKPVLEPGQDRERAPTVVLAADHAVLFFGQDRVGQPALAVAVSP